MVIPRDWIDDVKIEHRGEDGGMNITLFVEPPKGVKYAPTYRELTMLAISVFRDAVDPDAKRFEATHADVMAWSDEGHSGLMAPYRYRVTMDFEPKDGHDNA